MFSPPHKQLVWYCLCADEYKSICLYLLCVFVLLEQQSIEILLLFSHMSTRAAGKEWYLNKGLHVSQSYNNRHPCILVHGHIAHSHTHAHTCTHSYCLKKLPRILCVWLNISESTWYLKDPWLMQELKFKSWKYFYVSTLDFSWNHPTMWCCNNNNKKDNYQVKTKEREVTTLPLLCCLFSSSSFPHHRVTGRGNMETGRPVVKAHLLFKQRLHGDAASQPFICLQLHLSSQVGTVILFIRGFTPRTGHFPGGLHSLLFLTLLYPSILPLPLCQLLWLMHSPCLQEAGGFMNRDYGD